MRKKKTVVVWAIYLLILTFVASIVIFALGGVLPSPPPPGP